MFKKIVIFLIGVMMLPSAAMAQKDWANVAKYAKANEEVTVKPVAVLMGDSITEGWFKKDQDFFTSNNLIGRGISGQTSSHMLCRFRQDVVAHAPKYAVILAGANDIALNNGPITLDDIFANIVSMCDIAKANKIKPVLCSVLPCVRFRWRPEVTDAASQIIALNAMIKEYAAKNKYIYVDYHTPMKDEQNGLPANLSKDACHPTLEGYKIMEKVLLEALKIK